MKVVARRFWPQYPAAKTPGQRLLVGSSKQPLEIVGIAAPMSASRAATQTMPGFYVPNAQQPPQAAILMLRTSSIPRASPLPCASRLLALDRNQPVSGVKTLSAVLDASESQRQLMFSLLGAFSVVATLLAVLGLYSVISYSVVERTRRSRSVRRWERSAVTYLRLVLRQGLGIALGGIVLGIAAAAGVTRLLSSMLFDVKAIDPVTFPCRCNALSTVARAASDIPARRAAAIEPMAALRDS